MATSSPQVSTGDVSRVLAPALISIALVVAMVGSLGAPLITTVATHYRVPLADAQWTLTVTLLSGAVATPVLGRLGAGPRRRETILATLAVVVMGSLLTVIPLPFGFLIVGRAAQGVGYGLTALMMGVAREHLPAELATRVLTQVSVTSTVGIGVGYPISGWLADVAGLRGSYLLGVVGSLLALAIGARAIPRATTSQRLSVDGRGAVLMAAGLTLVLLLIAEPSWWSHDRATAVVLSLLALALLSLFVRWESRVDSPLVDVRLLTHRAVAGANITMLVGGAGMYLLLTLLTRFAQTPHLAGYGFGLSTFEAGLILVPFSALGFVAGRLASTVQRRLGIRATLVMSSVVVASGLVFFVVARSNVVEILLSMAALGFGIGGFSAAMPAVILAVTAPRETASAMGVNQVARSTGFSLGSAIGGAVLALGTGAGRVFPSDRAFSSAALVGVGLMVATVVVIVVVLRNPGTE